MAFLKAVSCLLLLAGNALAGVAASPNIILITLDTTRADRMGFLGSTRGLTPNLDRLARQSVIFTRAYAQVPLTGPSHATILSGTYPQFHHVSDMGDPMRNDVPYLPEILHRHGYHTAAFVGSQVLDPKSVAAPGFDRGFDFYDAGFHSRRSGEDRYHSVERRAEVVVSRAADWLQKRPAGPFFLWIHLYDPHDPYDPPEPFRTRYHSALYDGEIAYADFALGKLLTTLHSRGLYDQSVIAVMADHGEGLGEHGERGHGVFLYDETIRVPLLMKLPGSSRGTRVDARVSLVDIAPTLLQAAGIAAPAEMQGRSVLSMIRSKRSAAAASADADRPAYAETNYPYRAFGWSPLQSWRASKYLYIQAPERELYDQTADPEMTLNLAASASAVADIMATQLRQFRQKTSSSAAPQAQFNAETADQLQALGYISSSFGRPGSKELVTGVDPKQKIEIANLLHEGLLAVEEERYPEAIPLLEKVLQDQPNIGLAALALGQAWNGVENYRNAVPWLKRAVELTPASGRAHAELGRAMVETDDWAGAAPELEIAVSRAPDSEDLHFALATVYEHLERMPDAKREYEATLRIDPEHYQANLLLGRRLGMEDQGLAALPYLERAVKLQPNSADAHRFLANVYLELGRTEEARRERVETERLEAPRK